LGKPHVPPDGGVARVPNPTRENILMFPYHGETLVSSLIGAQRRPSYPFKAVRKNPALLPHNAV
jgi:hypothetical protein